MSKVKKIIKILFYILVSLGFLLLLTEFSLRYLLPLQSIKTKVLAYISQTIGAKVQAGDISAGLFGIELDNITLDAGRSNLFNCKKITLAFNPFKLLKGQIAVKRIYLEEPAVYLVAYKDGSFNFAPLLAGAKEAAEEEKQNSPSAPVDLKIKNLHLSKAKIFFLDLRQEIKAHIKNFNMAANNFSFDKPFPLNISFYVDFEQKELKIEDLHFALSVNPNLNNLDLQAASLELKSFLVGYKDTLLDLKGRLSNFENPSADFAMQLKNLSDKTLLAFAETTPFNIPLITAKGQLSYFTQENKLNLQNFKLKLADTQLDLEGTTFFTNTVSSKAKIVIKSVLDSLRDFFPQAALFKPTGLLEANFDFTWPLGLKGVLSLENVGFFMDTLGTFENINTSAEVKSLDEIKIDSVEGIINKNPFTAKATYLKKQNYADVFFDFKADKLYLIDTSQKEASSPSSAEQTPRQTESAQNSSNSFVPININAKVDIAKFDIPYLKGNKLLFTAKAKNITPQLDKTHGIFNLSMQDGQIKDIYTISNANALTKVMFMSLGIVSKVINTLNVLDLLNGMGKLLSYDEKEPEELAEHQEINGKMDFDSFDTIVNFDQGLATVERGSFVSDLFSFRVNGNINFDNRKIKLNVDSAPGKHTEDGIMPLNIDITGTVEEPKGSLSVLSSVSALVSDTVTNNPVSNMLKSTWGKLFSSDKKEE